MKKIAAAFLFAGFVPLMAFAQTAGEELRAQIRADLMQDPRASALSETEIGGMVNALATQAEEEGTADAYLEAQDSFDYSSAFPPPEEPSFFARTLASPMALALALLLALLVAVGVYISRRKATPTEISDISA